MAERHLCRLRVCLVALSLLALGFAAQSQESRLEGPKIEQPALALPPGSLPTPAAGKPGPSSTRSAGLPPSGNRKPAEGLPGSGDPLAHDLDQGLVPITISRLNPADRKLVLDTIALARAFRDEVAARERAYRETYLTQHGLEKTLGNAFDVEGAERYFPTTEYDTFAGVAGKGLGARHKNIAAGLFAGGGSRALLRPESSPDVDWFKTEDLNIEYIHSPGEESGSSLFAEWIAMPLRFYSSYRQVLDEVLAATGNQAGDGSIFFGLEAVRGAQVISPVFPATLKDGEWRLDATMREAVGDISVYLQKARASWRAYDRVIATDYPLLVTRMFARRARLLQESHRLHAQAAFYGDLSSLYMVREGTPITSNVVLMRKRQDSALYEYIEYDPAMERAWISRHLDELKAIDAKAACRAGLTVRPGPIETLGQGIFVDPMFHVLERAQTIPNGATVKGRVWGLAPHIKGRMSKAAVAAVPKGLDAMPAGIGVALEACTVRFPRQRSGTEVELADEVETNTAFGAADEDLP